MNKIFVLVAMLFLIGVLSADITVTGTICGSDVPTSGLAGAAISMSGTSIYTAVSDINGNFILSDVVANNTYLLEVSKTGYQTYTGNLTLGDINYNLGNIILYEIATPVSNVHAVFNIPQTAVIITWDIPDSIYRSFLGYKVWRLHPGQENDNTQWVSLTPGMITNTTIYDSSLMNTPPGFYIWAVKSFYSGNISSSSAFSNEVNVTLPNGVLWGIVRDNGNSVISGATIRAGEFTTTSSTDGRYSLTIPANVYDVIASKFCYDTRIIHNVEIAPNQTRYLNLYLEMPFHFQDDFEDYTDFSLEFPPWQSLDLDQSDTVAPDGFTWNNIHSPQSFMVFNPSATIPPSFSLTGYPHSGSKMLACWSATSAPNNDWLIIAGLTYNYWETFNFWAKSLSADYGLERFRVGVSSGSLDPNDFIIVSGDEPIQAPEVWTNFNYDFPSFTTDTVNVGIQCVSDSAYCLFIDDFEKDNSIPTEDNSIPLVTTTSLLNCSPNPFNLITTIKYSIKNTSPVRIDIFNTKGQRVKSLINETKSPGYFSTVWDGRDEQGDRVSGGLYFFKMTAGQYTATHKMILLKQD